MTLTLTPAELLGVLLVFSPIFFGWIVSVERRISKLEQISSDIHAIRETIEPLKRWIGSNAE